MVSLTRLIERSHQLHERTADITSAARVRLQVAPVAPWWATRTDGTDQQLYLGMAVRNKSPKA